MGTNKRNLVVSLIIIILALAGLVWFGWWLTHQPNSPIVTPGQPTDEETPLPVDNNDGNGSSSEPIFDESLSYSLDVKLANKTIAPVAGANLSGTVTVLGNNKPIGVIPTSMKPRLNVTVAGARYYYDGSPAGTPRYKTVIPDGAYLQSSYQPTFTTHFYSPQIIDQSYDPPRNSESQTFELDLATGKIDFGYIYGGGKTGTKLTFTFTTTLAGHQLTKTVEVPFTAPSSIKNTTFAKTAKGNFYYEVKANPTSAKPGKVGTIKLTITSKQSNGQIDTDPFQRVRVTIWPDKLDYIDHAPVIEESAGLNPPRTIQATGSSGTGTVTVYDLKDGEINYGWYWLGRNHIDFYDRVIRGDWPSLIDPRNGEKKLPLIVELDLVDGKAELTLLTLGRTTTRPVVTLSVQPADFDGLSIPIYSHRTGNFPTYPRKPEGYSFLYEQWYKDDSLKNQIYTIFELPLK